MNSCYSLAFGLRNGVTPTSLLNIKYKLESKMFVIWKYWQQIKIMKHFPSFNPMLYIENVHWFYFRTILYKVSSMGFSLFNLILVIGIKFYRKNHLRQKTKKMSSDFNIDHKGGDIAAYFFFFLLGQPFLSLSSYLLLSFFLFFYFPFTLYFLLSILSP